jgi:pantoate--beta-alanine ligase
MRIIKGCMQIIRTCAEMQSKALELKSEGKSIAVVPTMGYLHEGHLSLMREGRNRGDVLIATIFVNPTQFGPNEDLSQYPRDEEGDFAKCESEGVDIIFSPLPDDVYPQGYQTFVNVEQISTGLCGSSRPEHFRGVTTVCTLLFNLTAADFAIFGKKDFQQYLVIKRMVEDLHLPVKIVGMPIIREADGLAMSSRNAYLSAEERNKALSLNRSITQAQQSVDSGETTCKNILQEISQTIESEGLEIDYAGIYHAATLEEISEIKTEALVALAVRVGKTRLIDNHVLQVGG